MLALLGSRVHTPPNMSLLQHVTYQMLSRRSVHACLACEPVATNLQSCACMWRGTDRKVHACRSSRGCASQRTWTGTSTPSPTTTTSPSGPLTSGTRGSRCPLPAARLRLCASSKLPHTVEPRSTVAVGHRFLVLMLF